MIISGLITVLIFLAALSILVLVHEFGHFIMARILGVSVEEFGIGFPPRATGKVFGKTLYSINWIPLGGFVKLKGEQGESKNDPDSFAAKSVWKRLVIVVAGVVMNFLFAIAILTIGFYFGIPQPIRDVQGSANIRDEKIIITSIFPKSPAAEVGMKTGDVLESVDGEVVKDIEGFQAYTKERKGQSFTLGIARGKEKLSFSVAPREIPQAKYVGIGIAFEHVGTISYPIHIAFVEAVRLSITLCGQILYLIGSAIKHATISSFMGPVGVAVSTGAIAKLGFSYLISLVVQLSLGLAMFNILPFPALDGGRALFVIIEKIRRKPVSANIENIIHTIGFFILIGLVLLVTIQDIRRLFSW